MAVARAMVAARGGRPRRTATRDQGRVRCLVRGQFGTLGADGGRAPFRDQRSDRCTTATAM